MVNGQTEVQETKDYVLVVSEGVYYELPERPGSKDTMKMPPYLYWPVLHHENKS